MKLKKLSKEELKELSFIEIAQHIFEERREAIAFKDLVDEIASFLDLSEDELRSRMVQFYTDLNVNGSFISLGENRWGLRDWYPIDQIDEEVPAPVKPKKKKAKKAVEEDELLEDLEDEDLDYDLDDDFDDVDADDEIPDEDEDESLEALREEEEEEFEEEEEVLLDDDDYELEEEEEEEELELEEEEEEE